MFKLVAIPPPALSGSGSRVEGFWPSSQPGNTRLPVQIMRMYGEYKVMVGELSRGMLPASAHASLPFFFQLELARALA